MSTKKNLCYVIVTLIFFAFFSMGSGCGDTKYYNNDSGSSSKTSTGHYVPGNIKNFQITMKKTGDYYAEQGYPDSMNAWRTVPKLMDCYSMILTGNNIINSGGVSSSVVLDFEYENHPNSLITTLPVSFQALSYYKFVDNSTYECTEKDQDDATGGQMNTGYFDNIVTLVNNSTLKWSYSWKNNPNVYGQTYGQVIGAMATYQEITLRRVK